MGCSHRLQFKEMNDGDTNELVGLVFYGNTFIPFSLQLVNDVPCMCECACQSSLGPFLGDKNSKNSVPFGFPWNDST